MKNRFRIALILALFVGTTACEDGFLQEEPYSFISRESTFNDVSGLESAVYGAYAQMSSFAGYGAGYPTLINIGSGGFWTTQGPSQDLNGLTHGASTIWLNGQSPWTSFYDAINITNEIITYTPQGNANEDAKRRAIGEAHFQRGMLYFNLVRMFGGVPLRTAPTTAETTELPRSSSEEVYQLVISDLEKAKEMMPVPGSNLQGRPHMFAAYALLGKVYIAMAGDDNTSPFWQMAKNELQAVVDSGAYALMSNFAGVFDINNENNRESIIEIQYTVSGGPNSQLTNYYTPSRSNFTPLAQNGPFGRNRVNKEIYAKHAATYPNDPRIDVSFIHTSFMRGDQEVKVYPENLKNEGFPYIKKYLDPSFVSSRSNRNFIYLRYADVLLMLAECENEINGPEGAYEHVNAVLSRARDVVGDGSILADAPQNWSDLSQDEMREKIMLERRFELIGECHLYYDVRRRGVGRFFNFLEEHNKFEDFTLGFDNEYPLNRRLMLFPIPDEEINTNALISPEDQNPGY